MAIASAIESHLNSTIATEITPVARDGALRIAQHPLYGFPLQIVLIDPPTCA